MRRELDAIRLAEARKAHIGNLGSSSESRLYPVPASTTCENMLDIQRLCCGP